MTERFIVSLTPIPGWRTPPIIRLRSALKQLLRTHGLRAVEVIPADGQQSDTQTDSNRDKGKTDR